MKLKLYTKTIYTSLFYIIFGVLNAQSPKWFSATAAGGTGDDIAAAIAVDPSNGDTYTTGYFKSTVDFDPGNETYELTSSGEWDIFVYKTDAAGNFVWAKALGSILNDYGTGLALDAAGNLFLAGSFGGTVNFGSAGTFDVTSAGGVDMFVAKLDGAGNFVWAKPMGGTLYNFINSIGVDIAGTGGIYATGRFHGTTDFDPDSSNTFNMIANDADGFIFKLDNNSGDLIWANSIGAAGFDRGHALAVDPAGSGNVYTTGSYKGTVDFNPDSSAVFNLTANGNQNMFMSKLDGAGNFIWAITMDGIKNNYGQSIAINPAGSHIYTTGVFNGEVDFDPGMGTFNLNANGYDVFISKLDDSGNFVWAKSFGGSGFDIGYSIIVDPAGSGEVYTTGFYNETADFDPGTEVFNLTSEGGADIFLSKLDAAGNFLWTKSIGGPNGDYSTDLAFDKSGHLNIVGHFISSYISLDSAVLSNANNQAVTADFFNARLEASFPSASDDMITNHFSIFPNPLKNEMTIDLGKDEFSNVGLTIFNSKGQVCFSLTDQNILHTKTFDLSSLLPGIYFIHLNIDGENQITKVMKE